MKLFSYINTLVPSFEKRRILEDIQFKQEELKESVLPAYKTSATFFKSYRFKDQDVAKFMRNFDNGHDTGIRGNAITVIEEVAKRLEKTIPELSSLVDDVFSTDVVAAGLTYRKVGLLRLVESLGFFLTYSRRLLLWICTAETETRDIDVGDIRTELTAGEARWLASNAPSFIVVVNALAKKPKDISELINDIPDMVVTEQNSTTVAQTVGMTRIDPLRSNLLPPKLNPIYHIGLRVAEWQISRLEAAKQERKALEFRLLNLQNQAANKNDPALLQRIEIVEARMEKLNYKIMKKEEEYA